MLAEFLQNADPTILTNWQNAVAGVRVCRFSVNHPPDGLPTLVPLKLAPFHYEAFFCRSGTLTLHKRGGTMSVGGRDILLLSDCSALQFAQITSSLEGILVAVDSRSAGESLEHLRSLLGNLDLQSRRLRERMDEREGCSVIRATPWSRAVFSTLDAIPGSEQGMYCVLKVVELLYLLCVDSPLLETSETAVPDSYLAGTVADMRTYMESHLEEKLTIEAMSHRFHISPTAFKSCFRRLYGQPVHHWLQAQRMKRASELLRSTPMAVLEIAQSVGYEGASQFNVVFKRQFGMTPRQYKKMSDSVEN